MGKSPGKWIKNFLLGKKSSKSSPSKGREVLKSSNKGEQVVSLTKLSVSDPTISSPLVGTVVCNDEGLENHVPSNSQSNEIVRLNVKELGSSSTQTVVSLVSSEETEKLKLDQAATKAQAAFRGHAARREFQSQKCIIILQAQIRGHLVRRQAVSTLSCVKGIVKFQALVRGYKDSKISNSLGGNMTTKLRRPSKNAFVYKLHASLPTAIPLRLQYSSKEKNSASIWLERWTKSRFWDPPSEPKKNSDSKSHKKHDSSRKTEAEQDKLKRTSRRVSGSNAENGTMDSEKGKRNPKKVSSNSVNTLQEHSPNEIEKVKRGLRKSSDSTKEFSDRSSIENGKPKQRTKKTLGSPAPAVSEQGGSDYAEKLKDISELGGEDDSAVKLKDIPAASPKQSDLEKDAVFPNSAIEKSQCQSPLDLQPMETIGKPEDIKELSHDLVCKDDCTSIDNQKHTKRRASLPSKFDPQENGVHNTPKLPSYMAPTESAKAKLRAQGSPRFSQDSIEKNVLLRRHSLSSSTNSVLSSLSPRAHKLVQATGRGVVRGDRSFSSRDGGDKLIQAEWRR